MTTPEDLKQRALGKVRRKAKRALQAHKKKGRGMKMQHTMRCGCKTSQYGTRIDFCPLHGAARQLLAACEHAATVHCDECTYDHHGNCQSHALEPAEECYVVELHRAIAKAKGKQG